MGHMLRMPINRWPQRALSKEKERKEKHKIEEESSSSKKEVVRGVQVGFKFSGGIEGGGRRKWTELINQVEAIRP